MNGGTKWNGIRIALGGGGGSSACWRPVCLRIGIMVGAVVMRVDRSWRRIVIRTLRVCSHTLLPRDTLELCFCCAQIRAQCGVVGTLRIKHLSFKIIGLIIARSALAHTVSWRERR